MTDKTIALFSPSLELGGAERMLVVLANELSRRLKKTYLLLADASGPLISDVASQVEVIDLNKRGVLGAALPLANFLMKNKIDLLFSAQSHANIVALVARIFARISLPVAISERTTMSMHFSLEPGIKNRIIPMLARLLYHRADAVVCISQGVADDIVSVTNISQNQVYRIYNPALPAKSELERKICEPLAHPWFLPEAPPVLLAVGRLTAAKDYPTLLKAFAKLRQKMDVNLLILGDGEKRSELEKLIDRLCLRNNVQMPGFSDNPYAYMTRCSCFVLSSAWEGFSNVLVEALACGAPIVATNCKFGPAEILENGRYGSLVPVGDVSAMAEAIGASLGSEKMHLALRQRANAFSQENIIHQYLNLFDTLFESKK